MAYVITSACMTEKAADCVMVCPVDCIQEGEDQFFIDPNTCIDCGACVSACPVEAIYHEEDLLEKDTISLEKMRVYYSIS